MSERWVCRACFQSNDGIADSCSRCTTPRGETAPANGAEFAVPPSPTASQGRPWWQQLLMRFGWVGVVVAVAAVGYATQVNRDDTGAITGAGTLHISDVRVGDCFDLDDATAAEVDEIRAVPCDEPHQFEAFFAANMPSGPYPSRAAIDAELEAQCLPAFQSYVGRDYETSELYITSFEPTESGWRDGDRSYLCVASTFDAEEEPLTGSIRNSGR
jgi:hypothetical protein